MSKYSEEIHKKYHEQVKLINAQIVSKGKIRLAEELIIEILIAIDAPEKHGMDALMKRGTWLTRLFTVDDDVPIEWYVVGIYDTAQEAFIAGNQYVEGNQAIFDEQSGGKPPEQLVIELLTKGNYPDDCIEEQFIFDFLPSTDGAYIDSHGVTRASYLLQREAGA